MLLALAAIAADLPLEQIDFEVRVAGPLAEVRIHQRFHNPHPYAIDAIYRIPMDREAALDGLVLRLSDATIEGRVFEKQAAQMAYDQAAAAGQTAALTSFERFDVVEQRVANIQGGETIDVEISLVQPVRRVGDDYLLELPLYTAPRFTPEGEEPTDVPLWNGVRASIEITVDAGVEVQRLASLTHPVFARPDGEGWRVSAVDLPLERNFALTWSVADREPATGSLVDGQHLLLVVEPPAESHSAYEQRAPRELVFLLDLSSGGRGGSPNGQELIFAALQTLRAEDRFRLVTSSGRSHSSEALEPTPDALQSALRFVSTAVQSGSGLEGALEAVLAVPLGGRQRYVVVVSDGLTRNEQPIFDVLLAYEGRARVHALGASPSANRWVLDEIARLGGGTSHYTPQPQRVEDFIRDIGRPVVSGLEIDWGGWNIHGVTPQRIPDLHVGRPQHVLAQVVEGGGPIVVRGWIGEERWESRIIPRTVPHGRGMGSTWARARIGELGRLQVRTGAEAKTEGLPLALKYGVVSPWTSLLAVDPRPRHRATRQVRGLPKAPSARQPSQGPREAARKTVVRTQSTSRSSVLNKDFLTRVPTGRSYQSATTMAAGVQVGRVGENPSIGGGASNENTYLIEGASTSDPVSGTFSANAGFDAIEKPHQSLFAVPPEGMDLREGSNNLAARVGVAGALALAAEERRARSVGVTGMLSGPIVRDRLWFHVGLTHSRDEELRSGEAVDAHSSASSAVATLNAQPSSTHQVAIGLTTLPTTETRRDVSTRLEALLPGVTLQAREVASQGRWLWTPRPDVRLETQVIGKLDTGSRLPHAGAIGWSGEHDLLPSIARIEARETLWGAKTRLHLDDLVPFGEHNFTLGLEVERRAWRHALELPDQVGLGARSVLPGAVLESGPGVLLEGVGTRAQVDVTDLASFGDAWMVDVAVRLHGGRQTATGVGGVGGVAVGGHLGVALDPWRDDRTTLALKASRTVDSVHLGVREVATLGALSTRIVHPDGTVDAFTPSAIAVPRTGLPTAVAFEALAGREFVEDLSLHVAGKVSFLRKPPVIDRGETYTLKTHSEARRTDLTLVGGIDKVLSRRWAARVTYRFHQAFGTLASPLDPTFQIGDGIAPGRLRVGDEHLIDAEFDWSLPTDPFTQHVSLGFQAGSGAWGERLFPSSAPLSPYSARILPRGPFAQLPPWWSASVFLAQEIDVRKGKITVTVGLDGLGPKRTTQFSPQLLNTEARAVEMARRAPTAAHLAVDWGF